MTNDNHTHYLQFYQAAEIVSFDILFLFNRALKSDEIIIRLLLSVRSSAIEGFFCTIIGDWEANDSDIKETSIMRGGGGYYKAAHKQREREKEPVAECWMLNVPS